MWRHLSLVLFLCTGCTRAAGRANAVHAAEDLDKTSSAASTSRLGPEDRGACIANVQLDAERQLATMFSEPPDPDFVASMRPVPDLDRDGAAEEMWQAESLCGVTGNCPRVLYLSNHGCQVRVASLWAAEVSVDPDDGLESSSVQTWTKDGCVGLAGQWRRYAWDEGRGAYQPLPPVECQCPIDDDGVERTGLAPRPPQCPR
ncbi:MAG: hypothetical protein ACRBN8_32365 [Nannocystales bacterium]